MQTFTAKEIAVLCNTDGKTFRRFVRAQAAGESSIVGACGQGNRYSFSKGEAHALIAAFASWQATGGRAKQATRSLADLRALLNDVGDACDEGDEGEGDDEHEGDGDGDAYADGAGMHPGGDDA